MSSIEMKPIVCGGCSRKFAWKAELSGKRVRCKCGHQIEVHAGGTTAKAVATAAGTSTSRPRSIQASGTGKATSPPPQLSPLRKPTPKPVKKVAADSLDALMALSADADRAAASMPIEVRETGNVPAQAVPRRTKTSGAAAAAGVVPLAYRRGPTKGEKTRAADTAVFADPVRDLYVPIGLIAGGLILYLAYFGIRFHLGLDTLPLVGTGLVVVTAFKTAMLVGAALILAGPLGVSFGTLWSAVLKLAGIAVFTDGLTSWIDYGIQHATGGAGGGGLIGYGLLGWPVSIALYWAGMVYLFDMDLVEARLVVVLLGIFSRIIRLVIVLFLLQGILSWGGVSQQTAQAAGVGMGLPAAAASSLQPTGSKSARNSALVTRVDDLKTAGSLNEARKYIADGHQTVARKAVDSWYSAGSANVWFEMVTVDMLNHKQKPVRMIVQMPVRAGQRAECYKVLKAYYKDAGIDADPADFKDNGDDYLEVDIKDSSYR